MIGLVQSSYKIGQGEDTTINIEILDSQNVLEGTDIILFAMENIDKEIKLSYSKTVAELVKTGDIYLFQVPVTSALTITLDLGKYFFDITHIRGEEKKQILSPKSIAIVKTIGASMEEETPSEEEE